MAERPAEAVLPAPITSSSDRARVTTTALRTTAILKTDALLLACAHHTAGHQKFGDPLEAYKRFTEALV